MKVAILIALFVVSVQATGYGGIGGGFSGGNGGGGATANLAIQSSQSVSYVDVPRGPAPEPLNVNLPYHGGAININSNTQSSPVTLQHIHMPSQGSFQETSSTDEPHVRVHTVTRPIIQEVREVIIPQRIVNQRVLPVQEEIQTIVARGVNGGAGGAVGGGGFGGNLFRRR